MKIDQQLVQKFLRVDGQFGRRVTSVYAQPGGYVALLETVPFRNVGDELRPVIVSNEALTQQITTTNVPNRPPDMQFPPSQQSFPILALSIQIITSEIIRLRLGTPDQLQMARSSAIISADLLSTFDDLPVSEVLEDQKTYRVSSDLLIVEIQKDPFALRIYDKKSGRVRFATANDDRDVHGFLCAPLPGVEHSGNGRNNIYWSWALEPDEHLYGLGEHFNTFDQRGKHVRLWTQDAWGTTTDAAYKPVPFLLSSQQYGLFFHTTTPMDFYLGTSSARTARASVEDELLDLFVLFGSTPKDLLAHYTYLTGRASVPPRWAFGVWLSRCRYPDRKEVEAVAQRVREEHIPCDVIHVDPAWLLHPNLSCDFVSNDETFPDLPGMVRVLADQNIKVSLWELPYVSARATHYAAALAAGFFLTDDNGDPITADIGAPPADGQTRAVVDFTNPAARKWWQDLHRPLLQAGIAVFKTDFGEGAPQTAHAFNGMTGHELHNVYPLLYNQTVFEVIEQETGRAAMVWGRSGWAGTQRYPAQWGGDPKTDVWSMRSSLRGGLSFALSAPGLWSHDIGGFYGPPPSPELYIRWAQFGLLSPLARVHGTTPREPWVYSQEVVDIFRRYAFLRIRLNPYLYSTAWEMQEQGWPMLRPLWLEFPDDPAVALIDDVYLLGSNMLIAPIFSEASEAIQRSLYLPQGDWFDFWSDEYLTGGRYITHLARLETIPVYIKAGSVITLGPELEYIGEYVPDEIWLEVYIGAESMTRIVWDAKGASTTIHLRLIEQQWNLEAIGDHSITWHVRWHTGTTIKEVEPLYTDHFTLSSVEEKGS